MLFVIRFIPVICGAILVGALINDAFRGFVQILSSIP